MTDDRVEALVRRLHDEHCGCQDPPRFRTDCLWPFEVMRAAVRAGLELAAEVADGCYSGAFAAGQIRALAGKETP